MSILVDETYQGISLKSAYIKLRMASVQAGETVFHLDVYKDAAGRKANQIVESKSIVVNDDTLLEALYSLLKTSTYPGAKDV